MERKRSGCGAIFLSLCIVCVCILGSSSSASDELSEVSEKRHVADQFDSHTVALSSLFPSSSSLSCNPSTKATKTRSSLRVVNKHGACSHLGGGVKSPDHTEDLRRDQARVDFIHTKLSKSRGDSDRVRERDSADVPAKDGSTVGSGNYIVTVGIGTPKKEVSLIFDTGSDLTWTQCQPCVRSCYHQKEPIFNPSLSSSYHNVSCSAPICAALSSATGTAGQCSSSNCVYGIQYGDSSTSVGFLAKEKVSLTSSDVFDGIYFGCGEYNHGLFGGAAGLLGLGRDEISFPSQTKSAYNKIFSYCLPSSAASTGHLTFGPSGISRSVKFTPISTVAPGTSFYGLDIVGISVGGEKLPISLSVFSSAGAVIDSGTVITRLPPRAYYALRNSFRAKMVKYPSAPALSILDTCYDLSGSTTVTIPKIGFSFTGGVEVDVDGRGILLASKPSQVCLAFAGNSDDNSVAIFGNAQQKTLEVVYDGAAGRLGFASGGCD